MMTIRCPLLKQIRCFRLFLLFFALVVLVVDGFSIIGTQYQQQQQLSAVGDGAVVRTTNVNIKNTNHINNRGQITYRRLVSMRSCSSSEKDESSKTSSIESTIDDIVNVEKAWRYIKKPLISIGSKGVAVSHGNSLRQLLDAHTAVKVKINTRHLQEDQIKLKELAVASGASPDVEIIQTRPCDRIVLYGLPGTIDKIQKGIYPPPPPPPRPTTFDEEE